MRKLKEIFKTKRHKYWVSEVRPRNYRFDVGDELYDVHEFDISYIEHTELYTFVIFNKHEPLMELKEMYNKNITNGAYVGYTLIISPETNIAILYYNKEEPDTE